MLRRMATISLVGFLTLGVTCASWSGRSGGASGQSSNTYRLSHDLLAGTRVIDFAISPNGLYVAYTVQGGVGESEIWLASISGATHTKIAEGNVTNDYLVTSPALRFSADSSSLIFGTSPASGTTAGVAGLGFYDVSGGGPSIVLVPPLPPASSKTITSYQVSADGQVVIYQVEDGYSRELFRVVPGQSSEVINRPLVSGGRVVQFALVGSPERIVYSADDVTDERYEIYSLPLMGTLDQTVKVSHPDAENRTAAGGYFDVLGTSDWVRFASRPIDGSPTLTYVVPADGSETPRELYPAGQIPTYSAATRDGQFVVYSAYGSPAGIYIVPSAGPSSASTWVAAFDKGVHELKLVDQDRYVVWKEYNIDPYDGGVKAATLPPAAPHTTTLVAAGDPVRFGFGSSSRYFYSDGSNHLVSFDLELGGTPVVVDSSPVYANGQGPALAADGSLLVYMDDPPNTLLRVVPVAGPESANMRIDHQPASGAAFEFELSANGHSVVYRWSEAGQEQLYVADISALLPAPTPTATVLGPTPTTPATVTPTLMPSQQKVYLPALIH